MALGLAVSRRARAFTIPAVFLFGILLGEGGLGFLREDAVLHGASELGLLLMLFYTSLFGNPRALRDGGGVGLPLAAYDLLLNFAIAWWIGSYFGLSPVDKLFLAGILATSSTAVAMKILGDEGRISRREGNVLVSLLLIEDWVFLAFYGFLGIRFAGGWERDPQLLATGVASFIGFLVLCRLARHRIWRIAHREVVVALLTALAIVGAMLGNLAGLPLVGSAFTTGLALSGARGAEFAQREAPYLRESAAALFFVAYGALLGPILSWSLLPLLGACLLGVVAAELIFLPVLARRLGLRPSESFVTGASLLARGGKSAAFARLYPGGPGGPALFPLAGLLAAILTPLSPLLVRLGLYAAHRAPRSPYSSAGESFSRGARAVLIGHAYKQRSLGTAWARIVFAEWVVLAALLGVLTLVLPWPARGLAALGAALCLLPLWTTLRQMVRRSPGSPYTTHPMRIARSHNRATDHLPVILAGPFALLLLLVFTSSWSETVYPFLLGGFFLVVVGLPWLRIRGRRAPPLARALASAVPRPSA